MDNINLDFHQRSNMDFDIWEDGKRRFKIRQHDEIFNLIDIKTKETYTVYAFLHAVDLIFGFTFKEKN